MTHITSVLDRLHRSKRRDERGFSLIELIIVIVILGILVAIAIPVYNNIQTKAKHSAVDTAASNAASMAAANLAADQAVDTGVSSLAGGDVKTVTVVGADVNSVCATATGDNYTKKVGPGCSSSSTTSTPSS